MADIVSDGKTVVYFAPSVASIDGPTVAEVAAGEPLHDVLTADGFSIDFSNAEVDTTALSSTFGSKLPGRQELSTDLMLKDQGRTVAPWTTFAGKAEGFLIVRRNVDATTAITAGDLVEVYPVQAGSRQPQSPAANEVSKFGITLHHTSQPSFTAVVAA